jgi:hypothetical protein
LEEKGRTRPGRNSRRLKAEGKPATGSFPPLFSKGAKKMKNLKKTAAVALMVCAVCASAFAAKPKAADKENPNATAILNAQIVGFEAGRIWILQQPNGSRIRADLGKNGGRLWRLKDMEFTGSFVEDEKGLLFKMSHVKFEDPAIDERRTGFGDGSRQAISKKQDDRDVAFYYPDQVPTDNKTYITQNVQGVTDLGQYGQVTAQQLTEVANEGKVRLVGRPIKTIIKDKEMLFWDRDNQPFRVVMNGAFIPLGQRSYVYGRAVRDENGIQRVLLDMVESIE